MKTRRRRGHLRELAGHGSLCRSGYGSGKTGVAGGDKPSWPSRKTAQRIRALRRQKKEESQISRRGKAMEIWEGL